VIRAWPRIGPLLAATALLGACDLDYPEVVIVNRIAEGVMIRDPGFNGCRWNTTLAYGDHTVPKRCLPGEGRVHFRKMDLAGYARKAAKAEGDVPGPTWFNYRTAGARSVGQGDFAVIEIAGGDLEQDFSVPGPYGH